MAPTATATARASRASSRLPAPRLLTASVAAGVFARSKSGKPVWPSGYEARALTEHHSGKLSELFDLLDATEWSIKLPHTNSATQCVERDRVRKLIASAVDADEEDFESNAGGQLERYARR